MSDILGKWQQPHGQPFPGLWFEFRADGTYRAEHGQIDMEQTQHTLGLLGKFQGLYSIEGDTMIMTLSDPNGPRPESLDSKNRRLYKKVA